MKTKEKVITSIILAVLAIVSYTVGYFTNEPFFNGMGVGFNIMQLGFLFFVIKDK